MACRIKPEPWDDLRSCGESDPPTTRIWKTGAVECSGIGVVIFLGFEFVGI